MLSARPLRVALTTLLALVAVTLVACGGGGDDDSTGSAPATGSSSVGTLADAFPETTLAYAEATLRPDGELAENAKVIIGKLTGKNPDEVGVLIEKELNSGDDSEDGASWSDVKKFLGKRAAIGALSLDGKATTNLDRITTEAGFVIEVTDAKLAEAAISKDAKRRDLGGQAYYVSDDKTAAAVVDDRIVAGVTESAFKTMIGAQSAPRHLSDAENFKNFQGRVEGEPLVTAYADLGPLVDRIAELSDAELKGQIEKALKSIDGDQPVLGMTGTFAKQSIAFDAFVTDAKIADADGSAADLVKGVPDNAWVALGINALGKQLTKGLDEVKRLGTIEGTDVAAEIAKVEQQLGLNLQRDLLSWMGDVAVFARGTSDATVGGALVVQSTNAAASAKAITDIGRVAGQAGLAPKPVDLNGAKGIAIAAGRVTVTIVQKDGKLAIASNEQTARDALAPNAQLADAPAFKAADSALDGVDPFLFLDFGPIAELAKSFGDLSAEDERILKALDSLVVGSQTEGDTQHLKAALLVR